MAPDALVLALKSFSLPTMAALYESALQQAESENWGYRKFLQYLCDSEAQDRRERKVTRLLQQAGLPTGKGLGNLDESQLPIKVRRLLPTLLDGAFIERAENVLAFGLPGRGKTHFLAAVGRELILRHRHTVLFTPTFKLVQQLLVAKKELRLDSLLRKLDRYAVVIIDDLGYVQQDREEMEVLFTLLADRYERSSVMITSNLPFSQWERIFKDPMTTAAAIDRLVHHSVILELNLSSYRLEQSQKTKETESIPATSAVPQESAQQVTGDQNV